MCDDNNRLATPKPPKATRALKRAEQREQAEGERHEPPWAKAHDEERERADREPNEPRRGGSSSVRQLMRGVRERERLKALSFIRREGEVSEGAL